MTWGSTCIFNAEPGGVLVIDLWLETETWSVCILMGDWWGVVIGESLVDVNKVESIDLFNPMSLYCEKTGGLDTGAGVGATE